VLLHPPAIADGVGMATIAAATKASPTRAAMNFVTEYTPLNERHCLCSPKAPSGSVMLTAKSEPKRNLFCTM
jgi:hypothetical protein